MWHNPPLESFYDWLQAVKENDSVDRQDSSPADLCPFHVQRRPYGPQLVCFFIGAPRAPSLRSYLFLVVGNNNSNHPL